MVKLGKAFSILVVFTLLILLAPAMVLTGGGVAMGSNGEAVTEEIEATFTFSEEDPGGQWHSFTAGSGGIQAPGPLLEQFTRGRVITGILVPGCAFRNYTATASAGTVVSTVGDLNGTVTLGWITVAFPGAYPGDPKYAEADNYGWMMGRGRYHDDGDPASNFTFGFVIDWDGEAEMANATGKGFMTSANETGRFGEMTDPQELRHKIIGDFDVVKVGADYTWTFHLRNYPPNEIYNNGILLVQGGVLQENTDAINVGLDLVNFLADGPHPTPLTYHTDFEEVAFTRDPPKNITSGYLGVGGEMDVSRNTILFLEVNAGEHWVRIQGTTCNHIYINDTDTGVRAGDGSMYGEQNELLLLYIHDQQLNITEYFYQYGYTFTPFGLAAPCTDCYTGKEVFADAGIAIESAIGISAQNSTDIIYGLYPHPKCEGTTPACGYPGQNLTVTIKGKYFLRVEGEKSGWVNNSGSVSLGQGITVNSYTINTDNPIDNSITVDISIAPGAIPGPRVVNVTSCFNYTNTTGTPSGTAPYKSGHCNFTVALANATLEGDVTFESRGSPPDSKWIEPFTVRCFEPGNLNNEIWSGTATTNDTGVFTYTNRPCCTYDIGIKNWTCLSTLATDVSLIGGASSAADFGTVKQGDANNDDLVSSSDYSLLSFAYGTYPAGGGNWDPNCDFTRDEYIGSGDYSLLSFYYNQWGDLYGY